MQKVIYTDLEGVIVSHRSIIAGANIQFYSSLCSSTFLVGLDNSALNLIAYMAKKHGAKICINSKLNKIDYLKGAIEYQLKDFGFVDILHESWSTEYSNLDKQSGIDKHIIENRIEKYVVLDSDSNFIKNTILVNPIEGFSFQNFKDAQVYISEDPENIYQEMPLI